MSRDLNGRDWYEIYQRMESVKDQAKQRRATQGTSKYSELDEAGIREYKRLKQRERRDRQKRLEDRLGHPVLDAENSKKELLNAVLTLIANGDESAAPVLKEALKSFPGAERQALSVFIRTAKQHQNRKS